MDDLTLWSWSHDTTKPAVLERLLVPHRDVADLLRRGGDTGVFREALVLSTCNRLEVYLAGGHDPEGVARWLGASPAAPRHLQAQEAVRHVFRVASGLESRRLGEGEIHAQVRAAAATARAAGTTGPVLESVFDRAVAVSRRVRRSAELDDRVPGLAQLVADQLQREGLRPAAPVAVVGSGRLATQVMDGLTAAAHPVLVSTRRPREVAGRLGSAGRVFPLLALDRTLERVDAAVFATSVSRTIIGGDHMAEIQRRRAGRRLVVVDLGVPNNLDADVRGVKGVVLHDLDSVTATAGRLPEALHRRAADLVEHEVAAFLSERSLARHGDLITDLRSHVHRQVTDGLASLGTAPDVDVDVLARAIANKVLHPPTTLLKEAIVRNDDATIDLVRRCFGLPSDRETDVGQGPAVERPSTWFRAVG